MPGIIRLEWWRDPKGWDVVEDQWGPGNICERDRYSRGVYVDVLHYTGPETWLVPRTPPEHRNRQKYVLEGTDNRVFLELANAPPNLAGALGFLTRWGNPAPEPSGEVALRDFYEMARSMNEAVVLAKRNPIGAYELLADRGAPRSQYATMNLGMRFGRLLGDSTPRLFLDAGSLLCFCQAELLQLLEGGVEIRDCGNCGTLFALGRVGQQPLYCSDRCRVAAHRKNKRAREKRQKR
jgi:hypothetical protein